MDGKLSYLEQPCERCGNKKNLIKIHKATLKNLSGVSKIEYSQIICTNAVCQKEFEKNLAEKASKAEAIKLKREKEKLDKSKNKLLG